MKELEFYMLNKFLMNNICCFVNCWDMYNIVGNKRIRGVVD